MSTVLMWVALGMLIGMYGPKAIGWALTLDERNHQPGTRRIGIDELLSDDYDDEQPPMTRRELRNRRLL